jgi:hypothetical protein
MRNFAKSFLATALSLALLSCGEQRSPIEPLSPPRPALTIVPPSVSAFAIPLTDPYSPAWQLTALPTYSDPVIVLVSVFGRIDVVPMHLSKSASLVDASGYWREDSIIGCYVNVQVKYGSTVWPSGCGAPQQQVRSDTILVQGSGTVKRGGAIAQWDYECDYDQCWSYSLHDGVQSLSIAPLTATIDLTTPGTSQPTPGYIDRPPAGDWTLFRVAASPTTLKSINVPIRVLSWQWIAATGGAGQTVLTGGATAIQRSVYITENGRMVVSAVVNGFEQKDTVRVGIPPDSPVQCEGEAQTMAAEYEDTVYHNTLRPNCLEFRNSGGSAHFSWSELNGGWAQGNPHTSWGMIKTSLTDGLEATRTNYNRGPILMSSGYRCPAGNRAVTGVNNSFHTHGRAGDMYSALHGGTNWDEEECATLRTAAGQTNPAPVELLDCDEYNDKHLHGAW